METIKTANQQLPILLSRLSLLPWTTTKASWGGKMQKMRAAIERMSHLAFLEIEEAKAVVVDSSSQYAPQSSEDLLKIYQAMKRSGIIPSTPPTAN